MRAGRRLQLSIYARMSDFVRHNGSQVLQVTRRDVLEAANAIVKAWRSIRRTDHTGAALAHLGPSNRVVVALGSLHWLAGYARRLFVVLTLVYYLPPSWPL